MAALAPAIRFADAEVCHARLGPRGVRFRYSVLALFVDIDRLDEAHAIPLFSIGRFNLFGFYPADHGPNGKSSLRTYIDRIHVEAGFLRPQRVVLICFPRILGRVFNPIAAYCCADDSGRATSIVYEVRNTFGQRHTYLFAVREDDAGVVSPHECDKVFYVSPFMDMPLRYRFLIAPPREGRFSLKIIERDRDGVVLTALMTARAFAPGRKALLRRLAAMPLAGLKVVAAIHWQALRLWLRGHRVRPRPEPPAPVSVAAPGGFTSGDPRLPRSNHA